MFWLFIYRIVSTSFFLFGFPLISLACLLVVKWREGFLQKYGFYKFPNANLKPFIWLHAVSFGEVQTVKPLIQRLLEEFSEYNICITTGTKTGQDQAKKLYKDNKRVQVLYCPFDFFFSVQSFLTAVKPKVAIITETEIWPEILLQCKKRSIKTFLVNGRITEKSTKLYSLIRPLILASLNCFTKLFVQEGSNYKRFLHLGVSSQFLEPLPNLKFDALEPLNQRIQKKLKEQLNFHLNTKLLIAGSTHKGEEEIACDVYKQLPNSCKLVIVPRHLERLDSIKTMLQEKELHFLCYSEIKSNRKQLTTENVLLVDTLGDLNSFYAISDFAMLGGTWANIGGHNPLEPSLYGLPLFVGPYTYKIDEMLEQLLTMNLAVYKETSSEIIAQKIQKHLESEIPKHPGLINTNKVSKVMIESIKNSL